MTEYTFEVENAASASALWLTLTPPFGSYSENKHQQKYEK